MSEEDRTPKKEQNGDNEPGFNWRGLILISVAMALIASAFLFGGTNPNLKDLPYSEFKQLMQSDEVPPSRLVHAARW